jgi:hypothetical protein
MALPVTKLATIGLAESLRHASFARAVGAALAVEAAVAAAAVAKAGRVVDRSSSNSFCVQ